LELRAGVVIIDQTVAVVIFAIADLFGRNDLTTTVLFLVFARGDAGFADAFAQGASRASITGGFGDVVFDAVAVVVFAVADLQGARIDRFVFVVTVSVRGVVVFVGVFPFDTFAIAAELSCLTGSAGFEADPVLALEAFGTFGDADPFATSAFTDIASAQARGGAAFGDALAIGAGLLLGAGRRTTDGDTASVLADLVGTAGAVAFEGRVGANIAGNTFVLFALVAILAGRLTDRRFGLATVLGQHPAFPTNLRRGLVGGHTGAVGDPGRTQ